MTGVVAPQAAGVLVVRGHDTPGEVVLAVTRRGTTDRWGIPCGKVNPGESLGTAALREALEETGYRMELGPHILTMKSALDGRHDVTTFGGILGERVGKGEPGILVDYVPWETLFVGPFGSYNRALQKAFYALMYRAGGG